MRSYATDHATLPTSLSRGWRCTWQVGFYATGHSSLGSPTAAYVRQLPQLALLHPLVVGVMSFTMLAPCGSRSRPSACEGDGEKTWMLQLCAKGCAIADAFAELTPPRLH